MVPPGLHVTEHPPADGTAPLVVLVHGTLDRGTSFSRVRRHLADLHVITYDRRGYGRSRAASATPGEPVGPAEPAPSLDDHVTDLLDLLAGRRAAVVGHSFGGDVAFLAAFREPSVVGAVGAYEPPMPWVPWWPRGSAGDAAVARGDAGGPGAAAEAFMRRLVGDRTWETLPERTREARRAEGPAMLADILSIREGPPPFDPTQVPVPVVVACGTRSLDRHRRSVHRLAGDIPGAELLEVEGARHGAHTSHPREFAQLVRRVVARLEP